MLYRGTTWDSLEASKMTDQVFNRTGFKKDLLTLKNMVSNRIMNDLRMDCFSFGVDFGMLYTKMTDKLTKTATGRLSADDRIALHPVRALVHKWKTAVLNQVKPTTIGPDKNKTAEVWDWEASQLFDEIIYAVSTVEIPAR